MRIVPLYHRHRFPSEIISHCVWLYFRFSLSFRDVEELMSSRGVSLSYETVREWCFKFGQTYANALRRRSPRPGDKWHLDEVFLKINGRLHYLWRAVDQDGDVLDILVQSRRDKKAAKKFFRKLLKGLRYVPRVIVTDKLRATVLRERKSCRASNTSSRSIRTTGRRIHINRLECARKLFADSSQRATRKDFSRPSEYYLTLPIGTTSVRSQLLPSTDEIEVRRMGRGDLRQGDC
jgi:transposase-like protein